MILKSRRRRSRLARQPRRLAGAGRIVLLAAGLLGTLGLLVRLGHRDQARATATSLERSPAAARPVASGSAGWVVRENQRPGTTAWQITHVGAADAIEGFADHVSAQRGDRVRLFVSTTARWFHVEAYRMGWYGGQGGRLVWRSGSVPGQVQPSPGRVPGTNMVAARWRPSLGLTIGADWRSGDYLLKLVASTGQRYVPVTIRDDASRAALLVQNAVTTWQAYNLWGGFDLYQGQGGAFTDRSRVVSFDRPYDQAGQGAGDFLGNEYPLVRLVESLGLDVTYWTDVDLHEHPAWLRHHRALVSLGHDEYWSTAMRRGAELARDHGVNLAFLGANAVFRHIRLAPSPLGSDREEINYKPQSARSDPAWRTDPKEVTTDWREPPLGDPESTLLADLYECNPVNAEGVVVNPSTWVFAGTRVQAGTRLPGLIGPEYDRVQAGAPRPAGVELLLHSPLHCRGHASFADVSYYTSPSGAGVFDTGTSSWVCQLDSACAGGRNAPATGRVVRQATVNLLRAFAEGPAGRGWPAHPNLPRFHIKPSGL